MLQAALLATIGGGGRRGKGFSLPPPPSERLKVQMRNANVPSSQSTDLRWWHTPCANPLIGQGTMTQHKEINNVQNFACANTPTSTGTSQKYGTHPMPTSLTIKAQRQNMRVHKFACDNLLAGNCMNLTGRKIVARPLCETH